MTKVKLEVDNVSKIFIMPRTKEQVVALEGVSFNVCDGEFVSIVGPSGCGKSTLLYIIAGLEETTKGAVFLDGKKISRPGADRGVCFQDYALFPWKTVKDNIVFGPRTRGVSSDERKKIATHYLSLMGLAGFQDKYPHELSGGMRQRVALARLLANDPEILLMDEPLASVDEQTRIILQEELLKIWGGQGSSELRKTVVYVTHSIEEAVFLSDRIFVMKARPGMVKETIRVQIPRPRTDKSRTSSEFVGTTSHVWSLIKEEVIKSMLL